MARGKGFFRSLTKQHRVVSHRKGKFKRPRGAKRYAAEYAALCALFGDPPDPHQVYRATLTVPVTSGVKNGRKPYRGCSLAAGHVCPVHRMVAMAVRGGPLKRDEHVHHINGNTLDNRPENLRIVSNMTEHFLEHFPSGGIFETQGMLVYAQGPNKLRPVARVVLESIVGRRLNRNEHVGFRDGDRRNLAAENLYLKPHSEVIRENWAKRKANPRWPAVAGRP